ncbi:MAG: hypothetical protein ACE14V_15165 [bacterium]
MKRPNPADIQITKDFQEVLDQMVKILYSELAATPLKSEIELKNLVKCILEEMLYPADLTAAVLKYTEPKLQYTKSGPVGNASYASPKSRQDYARRLPSKPYEPTPARQMQQSRMQEAVSAWQSTDAGIQSQWNQAAIAFNLGGVHLFHGVYLALLIDNKPIPSPLVPTPEILQYYHSRPKK